MTVMKGEWLTPFKALPKNGDLVAFETKHTSMHIGWFRKSHECHENGLFLTFINYKKELYAIKEITQWIAMPTPLPAAEYQAAP